MIKESTNYIPITPYLDIENGVRRGTVYNRETNMEE